MIVTGITEIQFIAYLQLIRNRLKIINDVLMNFKEIIKRQNYNNTQKAENRNEEINMKYFSMNKIDKAIDASLNKPDVWYKSKINEKWAKKSETDINQNAIIETSIANQVVKENRSLLLELVKMMRTKNKVCDILTEKCFRNGDYTDNLIKIQNIYTKLEKASILINSSYGVQIIIILIIKFTTLTSLLYFCFMILIK